MLLVRVSITSSSPHLQAAAAAGTQQWPRVISALTQRWSLSQYNSRGDKSLGGSYCCQDTNITTLRLESFAGSSSCHNKQYLNLNPPRWSWCGPARYKGNLHIIPHCSQERSCSSLIIERGQTISC